MYELIFIKQLGITIKIFFFIIGLASNVLPVINVV